MIKHTLVVQYLHSNGVDIQSSLVSDPHEYKNLSNSNNGLNIRNKRMGEPDSYGKTPKRMKKSLSFDDSSLDSSFGTNSFNTLNNDKDSSTLADRHGVPDFHDNNNNKSKVSNGNTDGSTFDDSHQGTCSSIRESAFSLTNHDKDDTGLVDRECANIYIHDTNNNNNVDQNNTMYYDSQSRYHTKLSQ